MRNDIQVALIGLDTSHAVEFSRRLQAPDCPSFQKVNGLRVTACLRFSTPFTNPDTLAERTAQLEDWGIKVTDDFDTAVSECDAIIISINDPARHLEYFERCASLGKPIFLDKPLADTVASAKKIAEIAEINNTLFFSASSLRFAPALVSAGTAVGVPELVTVYGPLGAASAGSSVVWYGVHAFEMLEALLGTGASELRTLRDSRGAVVHITYEDGRRGIVELSDGLYQYGGTVRDESIAVPFVIQMPVYTQQLKVIADFFRGGPLPLTADHSLEIMKLLEGAQRSFDLGQTVTLDF